MSTLAALVRLTPTWRRLTRAPHSAGGRRRRSVARPQLPAIGHRHDDPHLLRGGPGRPRPQPAGTPIQINLHLETWGSIDVLVPEGVAVQMLGGSGHINLGPLSAPRRRGAGCSHLDLGTGRGDPCPPSEGATQPQSDARTGAAPNRGPVQPEEIDRLPPATAVLVVGEGMEPAQSPSP